MVDEKLQGYLQNVEQATTPGGLEQRSSEGERSLLPPFGVLLISSAASPLDARNIRGLGAVEYCCVASGASDILCEG